MGSSVIAANIFVGFIVNAFTANITAAKYARVDLTEEQRRWVHAQLLLLTVRPKRVAKVPAD